MFKEYLAEALEPSLLLGFLTSLLGVSAAAHYGSINVGFAVLAIIGCVLAQMSINLMDDYHDYAIGIDRETIKTKFSGGSKLVVSGKVYHKHVLWMSIGAASVAGAIGLYLSAAVSPFLLVFIAIGAVSIFFYAKYLVRLPLLAEPLVMVGFGLIGAGSYVVAHGSFTGLSIAAFTIVPAGILCGLVLFINEVPDAEIDEKYGRKHTVIILDDERKVASYYAAVVILTYLIILFGVLRATLSYMFLFVLLTLPAVHRVISGTLKYKNPQSYETYMATNIVMVFAYVTFLAIAYSL